MSKKKHPLQPAPILHTPSPKQSTHNIPGTPLDQASSPSCGGGLVISTEPIKAPKPMHKSTLSTKIQAPEPLASPPSALWKRLSIDKDLASDTPSPRSLGGLDLNATEQDVLVYHYKQGNKLCAQKKYTEAIEHFDQALKIDDRYANAHYNKGLALRALGRNEESMQEHEKALELNPQNILYLCSKGRMHLSAHEHAEALQCFQEAYLASDKAPTRGSFSQKNQEFIRQMLLERSKLLEHIASLQKASIENQKIIDAYQEHPAFREAIMHFLSLKQAKTDLIEECIDGLQADTHQTMLDLGAPTDEVIMQLQTSPKDSKHPKLVKTLYATIQNLSKKLASLEKKFTHQQQELKKISEEQELLQDKTAEQDMMLEEHEGKIQDLAELAKALEVDQKGLKTLIQDLETKGAKNVEKLLGQMALLKQNLAGIVPDDDLDLNEYETGFFQALMQDLIAAQSAASLVTNSDIIRNSKTGTAGRVGDFLDVAGDVVPEFGGFIQFFAAIISAADHHYQQQLVSRLSGIATTPSEMQRIAYSVAKILSNSEYFDKELMEGNSKSSKGKLVKYLLSFVEELADEAHSSNAQAKTSDKKHSSEVKTIKSFGEGDSHKKAAEESSGHFHWKLPSFLKKSKSGPADESVTRPTSDASNASSRSIDFLQSSDPMEGITQFDDSPLYKPTFGCFAGFRKHTHEDQHEQAPKSEEIVISTEEEKGATNAHIISAFIIEEIYAGKIPPLSFRVHTSDIIREILLTVFTKFDLEASQVYQIMHDEFGDAHVVTMRTETASELSLRTDSEQTTSDKKHEARKIASGVLKEIKKQVDLPEEFDSSAVYAITSRISNSYSSAKIPIIDSMMASSVFKHSFIDRLTATLVKQIKTSGDPEITLDSVRIAMKETERILSEEEEDFPNDSHPMEMLVWRLNTEDTQEASVIAGDSMQFSAEETL